MGLGWVKTDSVRGMYIQKFLLLCYTPPVKKRTATTKPRRESNERTDYNGNNRKYGICSPPLSDNGAKAFYSVLLEKIKELSKSEKANAA